VVSPWLLVLAPLVALGAGVQVFVGAGLSIVCGPALILASGTAVGVPTLLALNLLVSVVALAGGVAQVRWADVALAGAATLCGCAVALAAPRLPDAVVKLTIAGVLLFVALRRPPAAVFTRPVPIPWSLGAASLVSGVLTVWTATPSPLVPAALLRGGRTGGQIRQTMQPISVLAFAAALLFLDGQAVAWPGVEIFAVLGAAAILGSLGGFWARRRFDPGLVRSLLRLVAGVAAIVLAASVLL